MSVAFTHEFECDATHQSHDDQSLSSRAREIKRVLRRKREMEDEGSSLHTSSDGSDVELEMTRDDDDDGDPSRNNKQKRKKKEPTNIIRFI